MNLFITVLSLSLIVSATTYAKTEQANIKIQIRGEGAVNLANSEVKVFPTTFNGIQGVHKVLKVTVRSWKEQTPRGMVEGKIDFDLSCASKTSQADKCDFFLIHQDPNGDSLVTSIFSFTGAQMDLLFNNFSWRENAERPGEKIFGCTYMENCPISLSSEPSRKAGHLSVFGVEIQ